MVTKTYLPCNLCNSSDISDSSDNSDSCDRSDISDSSDSSESIDSSDSSNSSDRSDKKKLTSSFLHLFKKKRKKYQKKTQIVMKLKNSNCDKTQKLKL